MLLQRMQNLIHDVIQVKYIANHNSQEDHSKPFNNVNCVSHFFTPFVRLTKLH